MIEIGIQTKGIVPARGIDQGFQMIAEAGFTKVDINIDVFLKNHDIYKGKNTTGFFDADINDIALYFQQFNVAMEKYGITPSQAHAPYPVWVPDKPDMSEYMQATVIPKSIVIASVLHIPWMVIHPAKMQYMLDRSPDREREYNLEYFKSLVPLLKEFGVKICLENLYEGTPDHRQEGTCANPKEVRYYLDELNSFAGEELFGICLDMGHLQLVHRDPCAYIREVGSALKILHLHENNGVDDLHHMPFTFGGAAGEGQHWDEIMKTLAQIGFDGTLSFETFPCMKSFPRSCAPQVLKTLYGIGEYFKSVIEKERIIA